MMIRKGVFLLSYNENMRGVEIEIQTNKARLRWIMRDEKPNEANVLEATGTISEIVRLTDEFRNTYTNVTRISNQAYRTDEIKSMYRAGFRCDGEKTLNDTIVAAQKYGLCMVWTSAKHMRDPEWPEEGDTLEWAARNNGVLEL